MKQNEKIDKTKELAAGLNSLNKYEFERVFGIIEGLLMAKGITDTETKQPA